jgi:hypothetical protein
LQSTPAHVIHAQLEAFDYPVARYTRVCARLVFHYLAALGPVFDRITRRCRSRRHAGLLGRASGAHRAQQSRERPEPPEGWFVDDYFDTGPRVTEWLGASVVKYHRTIEDQFRRAEEQPASRSKRSANRGRSARTSSRTNRPTWAGAEPRSSCSWPLVK